MNELVIDGIVVTDPDLLAELNELDPADQQTLCQEVFALGAAVRRLTRQDREMTRLSDHLAGFEQNVSALTAAAHTKLIEQITALVDPENGTLASATSAGAAHLEQTITAALNTSDRESAASILLAAIASESQSAVGRALQDVQQLLDASRDDSPFGALRRELLAGFTGPLQHIADRMTSIESVVIDRNRRPTTGADGFEFEDFIGGLLHNSAMVCSDTVTDVGTETGIGTSKVGDYVVEVQAPNGRVGRFAVEVKDRKLGPKAMRQQLEEAVENRSASAALLVVSDPDYGWQGQPLHRVAPGRYVIVAGRDETDHLALRIGYQLARLDVLAALTDDDVADGFNLTALRARVDACRSALDAVKVVKGNLTTAAHNIVQSQQHLDEMRAGIVAQLAEIESDIDEHSDAIDTDAAA